MTNPDARILEDFSEWLDLAIAKTGDAPKVFSAILAIAVFELFRYLPEKEATRLLNDVSEEMRDEAKKTLVH